MKGDEENKKAYRQLAVFITIPLLLALPPLLGWYIGSWLDQTMSTAPWLMAIMLLLGLIAGIREMWRLLKRFGDEF